MNTANHETNSERAEYLRLLLPLMSRHSVPATPPNYAIWYIYVSGENSALNEEIDRLIAAGEKFTASVNAHLYRRFVSQHDLGEVDQVRNDLGTLVKQLRSVIVSAGSDAEAFEGALNNFAKDVAASDDLKGISGLLGELIAETRSMQDSTHSLKGYFDETSQEIESLQVQLQAERKRAMSDPLTGLYNRAALFERLEAAVDESINGSPLSLIMFDIDHFKQVNDNHGHLIGDRVIRFVAETLRKNIKGRDTAARFGGEEFTVLLPDTPSSGAFAVAQTIRHIVEGAQLVRVDNKKPLGDITISAGVSTYRKDEGVMEFINRADQALYRSKREGRNRVTAAS